MTNVMILTNTVSSKTRLCQSNKANEDRDDDADHFISLQTGKGGQSWKGTTMDTSLCIIPPDQVWDEIQRARHLANDPTFYKWPPAIRLFHPFLPRNKLYDGATNLADLIDKYNLQSFDITLNQLVIVPHLEIVEKMEILKESFIPPTTKSLENDDDNNDDDIDIDMTSRNLTEDQRKTKALIESEERKGKRKLNRRLIKKREKLRKLGLAIPQQQEQQQDNDDDMGVRKKKLGRRRLTTDDKLSYDDRLKKQIQQKKEFNGPCIICLEPDEESKIQLSSFRELLRKKLYSEFDPFSSSSTFTTTVSSTDGGIGLLPKSILQKHGMLPSSKSRHRRQQPSKRNIKKNDGSTFRPLLTIGKFSTVTKAIKVAKRLQKMWEPLTFSVTDLHFISRISCDEENTDDETSSTAAIATGGGNGPSKPITASVLDDKTNNFSSTNTNSNREDNPYHLENGGGENDGVEKLQDMLDHNGSARMDMPKNSEYKLNKFQGGDDVGDESWLMSRDEYGCDAMVMLAGEEWQLQSKEDYAEQQNLMDLVMSEAGEEGGASLMKDGSDDDTTKHDVDKTLPSDVESLLSDDEDWDEGATIVIGRTQFYMGEMRQYIGMPASSTIDGKSIILGNESSASARRRGAVHRKARYWGDGDFGQKETKWDRKARK